jgi:hypothetical protein
LWVDSMAAIAERRTNYTLRSGNATGFGDLGEIWGFGFGGSRGFVLASRGFAPGPHWCAARPRPPACRSASLCLALLAQGLLASLLLNFNSAALHGNSDGMSNQKLDTGCKAEKLNFFKKFNFWGEVN